MNGPTRLALSIASLLFCVAPDLVLASEPAKSAEPSVSARASENVAALKAAYRYAIAKHIETDGQVAMVERSGSFILVSFVAPCSLQHRCYGGRTKILYNPSTQSVVQSVGED